MSTITKIPRKKLSHAVKNIDNDTFDNDYKIPTVSKQNVIIKQTKINKNDYETLEIPNLLLPLKPHQHTAVKWMCDIENKINNEPNPYNIRGGILSDAPGLGKTLSTLCLCIKIYNFVDSVIKTKPSFSSFVFH